MTITGEMTGPGRVMEMLGGFQISQALYAVAEPGVSTALAAGPRTVEERERTADEYERLLATVELTMDRIVSGPTGFSFIEATL